jgi:hypothetical protein
MGGVRGPTLGEEGALAIVVAAVLLDDHVAFVGTRRRDPVEAVDVLERLLSATDASIRGRLRVDHIARVVAVRQLALAAELDLGGDIALALQRRVDGGDLSREPGVGRAGGGEQVGDAGEVVDAHVAARRPLEHARAAVRVGRVVLRLAAPVGLEGGARARAALRAQRNKGGSSWKDGTAISAGVEYGRDDQATALYQFLRGATSHART